MINQSPFQIVLGILMVVLFMVWIIAEAGILAKKIAKYFGPRYQGSRAKDTVDQMFNRDLEDMNKPKTPTQNQGG